MNTDRRVTLLPGTLSPVTLLALALLAACNGKAPPSDDTDPPVGTDTDTAVDTDPPVDGVDADGDGFSADADCDDGDPDVFPGAPDVCGDARVTDCDRTTDDGLVTVLGGATFDDLQAALDAAGPDAELLLCPGTWVGPFTATVPVQLSSFGGRALTVLDGDGAGSTLTVVGGTTVTGLTLSGGATNQSGGGLRLATAGSLGVEDCTIRDNAADTGGGIAIPEGSTLIVTDSTIADNRATGGGGLSALAGATVDLGTSVVTGNVAEAAGGGVMLTNAVLTGGALTGNRTDGYAEPYVELPQGGGGLAASGACTVTGTVVTANTAAFGGGFSVSAGSLVLTDTSVRENTATDGAGGGGIVLNGTVALLGSTEIADNVADVLGGGVLVGWGSLSGGRLVGNGTTGLGGGVYLVEAALFDTVIEGNHAEVGGGVFVNGTSSVDSVVIEDNTAFDGGGLYYDGEYFNRMTITSGRVVGNAADFGGGLSLNVGGVTLEGVTVADNVAAESGGGLWVRGAEATVSASTILRNAAATGGGAALQSAPLEPDPFTGVASLVSEGSDWGAGADDNVPGDVDANDAVYAGYAAGATFACDATRGCTPAP